ncbi:MAG TPA: hypothetical protein VHM67_10570 [Gemmatimonadaceae bacterium]|nr:hypothetical protein [Gemmatimonadaceae bacterium]
MRWTTMLLALALLSAPITSPGAEAQTAIIVNRSNALSDLKLDDARRYFLARVTELPNGEKVAIAELVPMRSSFYKKLLGVAPNEVKRHWLQMVFVGRTQQMPAELGDPAAVKKFVAEHAGAIGFIPVGATDETIKVLRIDGKLPSDADYPIK